MIDAEFSQETECLRVFHALADGLQTESGRKVDYGLNHVAAG